HSNGCAMDMTLLVQHCLNRTVRYEWLSQYHWRNLDEVRDYATQWMWRYNHERPNMALGGITPKQRLAMAA
ncbi:MAG: integrase core domain-containing protein, partial [Pseudomonadota bacterium]